MRALVALVATLAACALTACDKTESAVKTWSDVCVDLDHDGFGFQCSAGEDCDDTNSELHEGCGLCSPAESEGCACSNRGETTSCVASRSVTDAGALACEVGTRTCRDGAWSACEQLTVKEAAPESLLRYRAIIDLDASPRSCDPCHPNCYRVDDPLAETDGSVGEFVVTTAGGGVTLYAELEDGGVPVMDAATSDACTPGIAPDNDCDGIPDVFDPYPDAAIFPSTHQTIFLDLEPGKTKSSDIDIRFNLNTADIYLYVDMTGSMDGERTNLLNSFRTGNYLPDGGVGVDCADRNQNGSVADEEPLKNQGIVGNLACIVRDSWVGAGWHRDLPFGELDTSGFAYGPDDFELYQNEVDLTNDVQAVTDGLSRFHTRGGINRPEGGILGLHLIATGNELYSGWDRPGNPARVDCPVDRWGYPCFRKDAVPIVIWVTDAPLTNGPPTLENNLGPENNFFFSSSSTIQPMNWGVANTRIDTATSSAYFQVPNTNDTYDTAYDIGNINESFRTYTGDSTLLHADLTSALAGACIGGTTRSKGPAAWDTTAQTAPDAYFKFRVDVAEPLTISTRGGHVKSSIAIVDAARKPTTSAAATATNANSTAPNALSLGTINPLTTTSVITGTTASGSAVFSRDVFGSCLAQNTASGDKVAAGVVKFRLANDLPGGLRVSGDANYALATAVYAGPPGIPTDTALTGINVQPAPASTAATTGGNANDVYDSFNIGDLAGRYVRLTGGTTSTPNLTSNFASSFFTAAPACSAVTGNGVDAVVDFTLSTPTRVRLEGTGLNATLTAGFDHVIALVPRTNIAHTAANNNYTDLTAQAINLTEVPAAASGGSEYTGVLGGTPSDYQQTEVGPFATATAATACTNAAAAASTTSQAVFVMDVTNATAGTYDFETGGSAASTWLSLHRTIADTQQQVVATNPLNAGQVQDLGAIEDRSVFVQAATLAGHGSANADFTLRSVMGCTTSPLTNGGVDAIYSFRVTSSRSLQVGAVGAATTNVASNPGLPGFNAHLAVFAGAISATNIVSGGCDDPSGNGYTGAAFTALPNVTYYVVVKQINTATTFLTGSAAAYGLWLRDVNFANSFVSCNYGSQVNYPTSVRASRVTAALTAGRYYAVIKGTAASAYKFNVRRHNSVTPSIIACDRNSGGTLHSVIEQDLAAGKYAVIIRGLSTSDAGAYNLTMRDTGFAAVPIGCSYDGNTATPTSILTSALSATRNGTPIDYYAAVRGNTATGAYTIYLENGAFQPTQCAFDNCYWTHNDPNTNTQRYNFDLNNGEWTGTLQPGDYYAIVKGEDMTDVATNSEDDDFGRYQLSIGDSANHTGIADFGPKTWLGPAGDGVGGIRQELLDKKIRVVTVDSTRGPDDTVAGTNDPYYSNQQMQTVARETNAVHADGTPLFYTLNSDGSGLGSAIVQGVQEVSGNLAMDVTARLVEDPDRPSPHFGFTVEAVDMPGDSCGPPIDTDHDAAHLPDTHVACTAGATPKFRVTFTNPLPPNNIADNPNDANGGYNMRVELIGDDQFVIDKVPVYVVPENLIADPGDALFAPVGRYVQDSSSSGCAGTEAPLWTSLSWEDALPRNTSLGWEICTADTQAELDGCTFRTLAAITRGAACVTSATCPNGYCTAGGYCEYATGPSCTSSNDCGLGGVCAAGRCAWTQNPIDLKPVLTGGAQGKHFIRTRLTMSATPTRTQAPTVYSWGVKYTCTPQE